MITNKILSVLLNKKITKHEIFGDPGEEFIRIFPEGETDFTLSLELVEETARKLPVILFSLPIYYHNQAKNKMELLGMNKYERMHYIQRNRVKQSYYLMVLHAVGKKQKIPGAYKVKYTLWYKNPQSDAPNIIAVIDKLAMDGLQAIGATKQDNVKHFLGACWEIGGQDKDNPRVDIEVIGEQG